MYLVTLIHAAVTLALGMTAASLMGTPTKPGGNADVTPKAVGTRVEYVRSIDSRELANLAKPRSFLRKLVGWIAGQAPLPQVVRPYASVEDGQGRLLVADPGGRVVHILDFERRKYMSLNGSNHEKFLSPVSVAVDGGDNIYVVDSVRAQIYVFDPKGKLLRLLGPRIGSTTLLRPTALAINPARDLLYLVDAHLHQVVIMKSDGELVQNIGRRGRGPGEFNFPTSLALAGDELYIVDSMNFRIQVFSSGGKFRRSFGEVGVGPGKLYRPKGIAADRDGNLYVVDGLLERIQVFDTQGRVLNSFGSTGWAPGQFQLPTGIYINPRNRIFVADSYNRRIQIFRPGTGRP